MIFHVWLSTPLPIVDRHAFLFGYAMTDRVKYSKIYISKNLTKLVNHVTKIPDEKYLFA